MFKREDRLTLRIADYVKLWSDILAARDDRHRLLKLLRKATAGFVAITSAPGNSFVAELLETYLNAEVIRVTRDREQWWQSWSFVGQQGIMRYLGLLLASVPGKKWDPTLVTQFSEQ